MDDEELYDLADLFKMFGDPTRLKILSVLFDSEYNVNELSEKLSASQSAVSHQLKVLKNAKLVRSRREGQQMIYALADDHVKTIVAMGREHIEEE